MSQKFKNILNILLLYLATSSTLCAQSFDCRYASSLVENLICTNTELSDLDEQMTNAYHNIINILGSNSIKENQRNWITTQRNKCDSTNCLISIYRARIFYLKNLQPINNNDASPNTPIMNDCEHSDIYTVPVQRKQDKRQI
ncbi:MAG: DUF1311 domain-containing protein [Deltaproteobacteria bacterium]|nr:DUF1311 domain-containing protein [Deltaproteobacteria bacterium]